MEFRWILLCLPFLIRGCPVPYSPQYDYALNRMRECRVQQDCIPGYSCMRSPIGLTLCCTSSLPVYMQPWPGISVRYQPNSYNYNQGGYYQPAASYAIDPNFGVVAAQPILQTSAAAVAVTTQQATPPTTAPAVVTTKMVVAAANSSVRPPAVRKPPTVQPLLIGKYQLSADPNLIFMSGCVTLVQDNGLNIIVDTGLPTQREQIVQALNAVNLKPENIHSVVNTHGHPAQTGNQNLFTTAQFLFADNFYKSDQFTTTALRKDTMVKLTENIDVYKTPGHTADSVTVLVKGAVNYGNVAITDLYFTDFDFFNPALWKSYAWDVAVQQANRNKIACLASWIIPGHARLFPVSIEMKAVAQCGSAQPTVTKDSRSLL